MSTRGKIRRAGSETGNSTVLNIAARAGFAANGVLHLLLGYLSIRIALHHEGESDQSGALAQLAKLPGGTVILWLLVAGFAALGLWLLLQASLGIGSSSKKRWVRSIVSLFKAIAYLALGWTALTFAMGGSTDATKSSRHTSGTILALPGGQLLLIAVGLVTAGIGGYFIYKGARQKFKDDITVPQEPARRAVLALGVAGYVAKGVAVVTVGILFIVAAVRVNPKDGSGLDGALKALTALPFGQIILVVVGVGLIAYGVYSFARAKLARL
ncbi:DUF1206 domain-containing protein [Paenarthrobacter sp. Z7-10]|uniref:DUF1206 domain-containing protein n=1 Tax=Paenarthrobacter sp. Z7-10 TaxID=2787635 RepID=UPI0022A925D3|nr:DUF1206 domain-containing protein [Paenarthrobacter sp. Z7-10]MCZ2404634.1 DUF1206 domain-containing protein [Paenarthrobacter sp. Z7-10]